MMTKQLEDEDKLHLLSLDDDEENQCIRLLSFCKRHKQPTSDRPGSDAAPIGQVISRCCDYAPPLNPSGCARTGMRRIFLSLSLLHTHAETN